MYEDVHNGLFALFATGTTMPVSNPTTYTRFVGPTRTLLVEKTGKKGGSRDKPKAYAGHVAKEKQHGAGTYQSNVYNNYDLMVSGNGSWTRVESKLHAKIVDTLGDRAELGTTLAEARSALDMVRKGAMRLAFAAYALKKGAFRQFLEVLNVDPLPKHRKWYRTSPKVASGLWIEYWFGWAPTINDIQTSAAILDKPQLAAGSFDVRAAVPLVLKQSATASQPMVSAEGKVYGRCAGHWVLVNPTVALAQQLGLLNPLEIAVNVTPWSWLLGWFVNLQQWVSSLTAFAGYTFSDYYLTKYATFKGEMGWKFGSAPSQYNEKSLQGYYMVRALQMPSVKLYIKPFNLTLTRAATAVSLLTLRLKSL